MEGDRVEALDAALEDPVEEGRRRDLARVLLGVLPVTGEGAPKTIGTLTLFEVTTLSVCLSSDLYSAALGVGSQNFGMFGSFQTWIPVESG